MTLPMTWHNGVPCPYLQRGTIVCRALLYDVTEKGLMCKIFSSEVYYLNLLQF
jgi:hypothetical protein